MFTEEQIASVQSVFGAVHLEPQQAAADGATESTHFGYPIDDLCKEEQWKANRHPWELWGAMRELAKANTLPEAEEKFLFKHHGIFDVSPVQTSFMTRLRIPGCKVRGDQMIALGHLSTAVAGGYAHVTTRGNLQMREIPPAKIMELFYGLSYCGLSSMCSGADSARNITCSLSAGFDPDELIDLSPYALELNHLIRNTRDLNGIPRKFNFAFDNGGSLSVVSTTNDVAFIACQVLDGFGLEPGIYCRIAVGGITGHGDFARETWRVIRSEQCVDVAEALLQHFAEHGTRDNRSKARLKYLLEDIGDQAYIDAAADRLGIEIPLVSAEAIAPAKTIQRQAHIGIHPQAQDGYCYVGIALPVGRLSAEQMHILGELSQKYGRNDIRLTVWQNALIPYVPTERANDLVEELTTAGLPCSATSFAAGMVACTGNAGCKFAGADTKATGLALINTLNEQFDLQHPINIHVTGCQHSCAQHYIGDIGLIGSPISGSDGKSADGYQIVLGGGADTEEAIANQLTTSGLSVAETIEVVGKIIEAYISDTQQQTSFTTWAQSQAKDLSSLCQRSLPAG
jgi:ferredoxin-nitrite reductase